MKYKTILFGLALFLFSCTAGLERIEIASDNEQSVFADKVKTRKALNNLYANIRFVAGYPSFNENGNPQLLDACTDNGSNMLWGFRLPAMNKSTLKPGDNVFASGNLPWRDYYKAVRSANLFLANIDNSPLTQEEKEDMKLEVRFLRTLYYCEMFKSYGALVLLGDAIPDGISLAGFERATLDQTVEYIVGEFDYLIPLLKWEWSSAMDYGRATKGMAMGYKARMLLYYASPLNTEGLTESQIKARWQAAANAADDLMKENKYDLHPDYAAFFYSLKTSENILSCQREMGTQAYTMSLSSEYAGGNVCAMRPTFNMVDAYAMKDGKSPILGYNASGQPIFNPQVTNYNDTEFWLNRDPRLAMQIFRQGDKIPVNGTMQTLNLRIYDENSASGRNGFLVKKYMNVNHDFRVAGNIYQNPVMLRFADILLMYAEAENQANGPSSKAIQAINRVRVRAGADPLDTTKDPYGQTWTKSSLNEQIVLERRMEFFGEEQRFWDARRWKRGPEMLGATVYGGLVGADNNYTRYFIEERKFDEKMYRLPIPPDDVNKSGGKIWQNTGW